MKSGSTYHIYSHANGFESLYTCDENFQYFLKRYIEFVPSIANTLAYCLMPNHFHFLIRIKTDAELLEVYKSMYPQKPIIELQTIHGIEALEWLVIHQVSKLLNAYTQAFNKMHKRRGSLFIPSFKRKNITSDSYLTSVIHYLHANPVHHGFAKAIEDWPWSSYRAILDGDNSVVKSTEIWEWFGSREEFISFHQKPIITF